MFVFFQSMQPVDFATLLVSLVVAARAGVLFRQAGGRMWTFTLTGSGGDIG